MMPHIYEFDWSSTPAPRAYYLDEHVLDNSNVEKILCNKFHDPLLSSEDEDAEQTPIDWDEVLKNFTSSKEPRLPIPGVRQSPLHPKLSALTGLQHFQCLKVLCAWNPHVFPQYFIKKPNMFDFKNFQTLQEVYIKEQKEYIEWAKSLWVNQHCAKALRPRPTVETTYEAEFKVRAHRLGGFPTHYDMAAQIPLECTRGHQYNIQLKDTLIPVNLQDLPEVKLPSQLDKSWNIMRPCTAPEPCHKHPCQFILPNEDTVSMLPISEVHRELAQFAADKGTRFIASENALRCLVQFNRYWTMPISVCQAITPDGERRNVVVLDSEFSIHKEPAMMRTYRAFKHLLENTLIPDEERERVLQKYLSKKEKACQPSKEAASAATASNMAAMDVPSDDDSELLVIAEDDEDTSPPRRSLRLYLKNNNNNSIFKGKCPCLQELPAKNKKSSNANKKANTCEVIKPQRKTKNVPRYEEPELSDYSDFSKLVISDAGNNDDKIIRRPKRACVKNAPSKEPELSNDEEDMNLVIHDDDATEPTKKPQEKIRIKQTDLFGKSPSPEKDEIPPASNEDVSMGNMSADTINDIIGVYSCTCTDTPFEAPPARSFVSWGIKDCASAETVDVIVHCAHKAKTKCSSELIVEPIPEYQLELGACEHPPDRVRGVVLALMLRQNASVLNVRLDGSNGEIVRLDQIPAEQFLKDNSDKRLQVVNVLHTALSELQELVPGHYVLKHEPQHGANALLFVSRANGDGLTLSFDSSQLAEADEARMVKAAPTLTTILLPIHKHRKMLPCAFTPYENMVMKETKKPPAKQKPPPQAIKWPKRKNRKAKKN